MQLFCVALALAATASAFRPPADMDHRAVLSELEEFETHVFSATKRGRHLLSTEHHADLFEEDGAHDRERMTYSLSAFGNTFDLIFRRHTDLFSEDFKSYEVRDSVPVEVTPDPKMFECFYHVYVAGEDSSRGHASLCGHGLRGAFQGNDGERYAIQPIDAQGDEHVVYRHRDLMETPSMKGHCGNTKIHPDGTEEEVDPIPSGNNRRRLTEENPDEIRAARRRLDSRRASRMNHPVDDVPRPEHSNNHYNVRRRDLGNQKIIGVGMVSDYKRFLRWGEATAYHSANIANGVDELYSELVSTDTTPTPAAHTFKIQVVSMYVDANDKLLLDNPVAAPGCPVAQDAGEIQSCYALENLAVFANSFMEPSGIPDGVDTAHALMEEDFNKGTIGLAYVIALCSTNSRAGVTQATSTSDGLIISTMTHEIGHNLGMKHITEATDQLGNNRNQGSICGSGAPSAGTPGKIMDTAAGQYPNVVWSVCSRRDVEFFLENTVYTTPNCAEVATVEWDPALPLCGDGFVSGDEDCDCLDDGSGGDPCSGIDDCCDGTSCTYIGSNTCSEQEPCCTLTGAATCSVKTNTAFVCRAAVSVDCDAAETCDGVSGRCPSDQFTATGQICQSPAPDNEDGTCFFKECVSHDQQCIDLGYTEAIGSSTPSGGNDACDLISCTDGLDSVTKPVYAQKGVKCSDGKGCVEGVCTLFEDIRFPKDPRCENEVRDNEETDVDCGGTICIGGCLGGKRCVVDTDCINPSTCDLLDDPVTKPYLGNSTLYGKCTPLPTDDSICPIPNCPQWLEDLLQWFVDNIAWTGPVFGGALFFCLIYCCFGGSNQTKDGVRPYRVQRMGNSMRNMRARGAQRSVPTAQYA